MAITKCTTGDYAFGQVASILLKRKDELCVLIVALWAIT